MNLVTIKVARACGLPGFYWTVIEPELVTSVPDSVSPLNWMITLSHGTIPQITIAQLRHVINRSNDDLGDLQFKRKEICSFIRIRKYVWCCRGFHTITKSSKPLGIWILSHFIHGHKRSFVSNDCNFRCEINNKAVAAQIFVRR